MNLALTLQQQARLRPTAPAIIERDGVVTFADLEARSCRAARLLTDAGLRAGDAVLVFHPMSAELYVCLLALFRLRLVAMFLDPSAGREHIERCCRLHRPRAFIGSSKAHLLRVVSPALRRIPIKVHIGFPVPFAIDWRTAERLAPLDEIRPCDADTPALLTFTSGSTGLPKAAVRSHGFLDAQHRALIESLHLSPGDRDLATLPIVALANLGSGVTTIIPDCDLRRPGFIDPAPVVTQMLAEKAVSSVASPAFFECLARHCLDRGIVLPDVKKLYTGGAPVFPRLLDRMQRIAPNADIVALYGSTEAEPIAHVSRREISPSDQDAMVSGRGLLAGVPVECVRLRILRDRWGRPVGPWTSAEFDRECRGTDEPGEIVVSGGHVLTGYLHGRGDEETKFRVDGVVWHRTGDAGYLDSTKRLWLLGRCVARIADGRGEVFPFAVETAALQDDRLKRAALVAHRGKRVLVVETTERPDLAALRSALGWAHLDEVRHARSIPVDKRHNAKIDYPALLKMLERR